MDAVGGRQDTCVLGWGRWLLGAISWLMSGAVWAVIPEISSPPMDHIIYLGDSVSFEVEATGTAPLSFQWLRNGVAESGASGSSYSFVVAEADDGDQFSVRVTNGEGSVTSAAASLMVDYGMAGAMQTNQLVAMTAPWRYEVNKTNLVTSWRGTGYSDAAWPSGGGLLYVETSALPAPKTTALPLVARDLPTTCYFRTWFTNSLPDDLYSVSLVAHTVVDDGIVLYLNGSEVLRNHMADGTVIYSTLASTVTDAALEGPYALDMASLVDGANLLAAEVHQSSATSSDIVMGTSLDLIWAERVRDTAAPEIVSLSPAAGSQVATLTQIDVEFDEGVLGLQASDLLMNGVAAVSVVTNSESSYSFQFSEPAEGVVNVTWASGHGIRDRSGNANAFVGVGFSYLFAQPSEYEQFEFARVFQSSDASAATQAANAVDGLAATDSLTDDVAGSYWQAELGRSCVVKRVVLVNRSAPDDAELEGQTLRVFNMDDQVVYETVLSNPGSGGMVAIDLPEGTVARGLRIGLDGSDVNGAGTYRVGLTEVQLWGDSQVPYMPEPYDNGGGSNIEITGFSVSQSTEWNDGEFPAENAVDGNTGNFSHTDSTTLNNYWMADLGVEGPIARVELVNRNSATERMDNLVIRIMDASMNSVASDVTTNPGGSATYTFDVPENTEGRYVRVGLENNEPNGRDYAIQLAEVRIYSHAADITPPTPTSNLATLKRSYMLRLHDGLEPASNVNDGDMDTEAVTTTQTVDGYWEVDLGETYALYGVRAVCAVDIGDRLTNTICRLFDEAHDSVQERPVTGGAPSFDVDLDGPVYARYVRIGLEDKTRTDGNPGGFIGFREVEVFGRPADEVGIQSFTVFDTSVSAGQSVTLDWSLEDVMRAELYPSIGSVGAQTDTNGVGSLVQTVSASTEFILVATNHAGIFTEAVGVEVNGASLPVVISEVVADNKYSLEDGYGDAPDWIEIRNTGNSSVDLTGWGLSDKVSEPMKWVFPSTNIAAHSTLIVFASKNDSSIDPAGMLHADFSLDKEGETIQLTKADGSTVVDSLTYVELDTDLAYGRALDGGLSLMEPTPGAVNTGKTYAGWLNTLDWSHARGMYETNFTLTVSSVDPQATILYSLDGTEPSIPYTTGLSITGTSVVRIQAVWPGYKSARIQTKSFIFLDDVITSPVMNTGITQDPTYGPRVKPGLLALPTLSLVVSTTGDVEDAIEYDEIPCSLEILWPDGQKPIQEDCGVARFGGAYSYFAKKGLSLSFRQKYGNGKLSAPLFNGFDRGVLAKTSFDKLHLRGGNHDFTRSFGMSDRFIQDSFLDMGSLNPHGRFVQVYLNGIYWGLYNLKEVLNESFLADYLGGSSEDYVSVKGNDNGGGGPDGWVIGAGDPPNPEPWERVRELMGSYEAVRPYLDVSHYIDYMLLYGFGGCENEFRACGPRDAGSGFKFWLNDPDGFVNDGRVGDDKSIGTYGPGGIWDALLSEGHVDFKILLADRIYKNFFNNGAMTTDPCISRLEARMDETRDSFVAECARWNRSYTSWETAAETAYNTYFTHQASDMVAAWRTAGYFPAFDPPTFNQYGGAVPEGFQPTLSSSDGTIYYTLDGTDPREPGGAISSAALIWSAGAVTVTEDVTITTRVRTSGGSWSALAEPRFLLGSRVAPQAGELLISEINYNPDGPDDYEFIELWNRGTNVLDLSGVNVSNAVRYIFPEYSVLLPGEFVVIAEDRLAFATRYQDAASPWYYDGISLSGEWVGGLSDGGETISLVSSNGAIISSVSYRSDGDWPERPDGGGSSLQLATPYTVPTSSVEQAAYLADGRNWSESLLYHGSPGRFEPANNAVVINEVLSHTDVGVDWIEFYNSGDATVDLSGMGITDDLAWPNRYVIPNGTTIDTGEYWTVSLTTLGFGFSELGSEAALVELSGSNLVAMIDHVTFPAVQREEPFGRYERSDGIVDFTELLDVTPETANELPRVGPVVISEIMYAPELGKSEYIEIKNISSSTVPLYDTAIPTNTWDFSGVGDISFPQGLALDAGESLILCATNAAAFRTQYAVDPTVAILGPWSGGLAAEGEKLQLLSPGDPEPDGFVPMYRADRVSYRTNSVWAAAYSGGISLERSPLDGYGNDPASWTASLPGGSPGREPGPSIDMGTSLEFTAGNEPSISFATVEGETYEVRYTDSLMDLNWNLLESLPTVTTNWIEVVDPVTTNKARFYRILWQVNPTD